MKHSTMDNLWYSSLGIQDYLILNEFTTNDVRTIFSFRTKMANFGGNFENGHTHVPCPLCHLHLESQAMAFQCSKRLQEVKINGSYDDLFKDKVSKE